MIHWKKNFPQATQNWQLQQPHFQMKLGNSQQIMQTSKDLEHRKAPKPEADFCIATGILLNWKPAKMSCDTFSSLEAITVKLYMLLKTGEAHLLGTTYLPLQKDCSVSYTSKYHASEPQQHEVALHIFTFKTTQNSWQKVFHHIWFSLENTAQHPLNHVSKPLLREPVCLEITSRLFSFTTVL